MLAESATSACGWSEGWLAEDARLLGGEFLRCQDAGGMQVGQLTQEFDPPLDVRNRVQGWCGCGCGDRGWGDWCEPDGGEWGDRSDRCDLRKANWREGSKLRCRSRGSCLISLSPACLLTTLHLPVD